MLYLLETDRFLLREFQLSDAPGIFRLNLHPDILRFTTDPPFLSEEEAETFIRNYDAYRITGMGRLAIIDKLDHTFIGWCGLKYIISENEVDIGYRLLPEFWGLGIAVETASACCNFGNTQLGIKRIVARIHPENLRSVRVSEKLNMRYEKELIYDGKPWLNYVYMNHKTDIDNQHHKHFPYFSTGSSL